MNKKLIKNFAIMGIVPAIAFANPLAKFSDPLCINEPLYGNGMPHPSGHPGIEFGVQLPPYLHGIDLTENQQNRIKDLIQKNKDAMKDMEKVGIEYHLYTQKQVFSKDYSDEKVTGMIKSFSVQQKKIEINMAKQNHAIFELLTPEQQQQVQSNLITFAERMKKMQ